MDKSSADNVNNMENDTQVKSSEKAVKYGSLFSLIIILILVGLAGFLFYQNIQLREELNSVSHTQQESLNELEESEPQVSQDTVVSEYDLTGWVSIGAGDYKLVYESDWDSNIGSYVLKSGNNRFDSIVLHKEEVRSGFFRYVRSSPRNQKFVVQHISGDSSYNLVIGVEVINLGELRPINPIELNFNDSEKEVIGWIDDSRVIGVSERTVGDETPAFSTEYWIAPVNNFDNKLILDIPIL